MILCQSRCFVGRAELLYCRNGNTLPTMKTLTSKRAKRSLWSRMNDLIISSDSLPADLSCVKTVNVHQAKTGFCALLAEIERKRSRIVICRNGKPVADLVPHRTEVSMEPDKKLGAIGIHYDPMEDSVEEEWPSKLR
jgi:antitoxin (DNA-binding transcriptional repressor) of toxin-antitoxin stability system